MRPPRIELLPVRHGDAIWLEWSTRHRTCRFLIDGGPGNTYPVLRERVLSLSPAERRLDLLVITHVDTDHIDGAITLLLDDIDLEVGDIWFNGREHLKNPLSPVAGNQYLGGVNGEILSAILALPRFPWNEAFRGCAVVARDHALSAVQLDESNDLTATILSPREKEMKQMFAAWDVNVGGALKRLELVPNSLTESEAARAISRGGYDVARRLLASRFGKRARPPAEWDPPSDEQMYLGDSSKANASSIALLLEDKDHSLLLAADATEPVLFDALTRLTVNRGVPRLHIDAFKLSHHGSKHNISERLLNKLDCDRFLFSTDGSHGFDHPDDETVELIIDWFRDLDRVPSLYFNYCSERTRQWGEESSGNGTRYHAHYPKVAQDGMILELI